jgi:glucose-1-phosphate thymidylyltransferase
MLAGIREILIIVTPEQKNNYEALLGDGSQLGLRLSYKIQHKPNGIPEAFVLGSEFISNEQSCLILGDNIFHGASLGRSLAETFGKPGANIFAYEIDDPSAYGVVEYINDKVVSIEEKPTNPRSNFAIPGLYFFDANVCEIVRTLKPSIRGETEIVDLLKAYLANDLLNVKKLPRGTVWMDSGTPKGLHDASSYIRVIEERQGLKVACLEEIALLHQWITLADLERFVQEMPQSDYRDYLKKIILRNL